MQKGIQPNSSHGIELSKILNRDDGFRHIIKRPQNVGGFVCKDTRRTATA